MAKNPADTFFWNDWDNDPALRLCSLGAQGFWMRCLCIAARHTPKGFVASEGRPLTYTDLARTAGCSEQEAEALMTELLNKGVASRDRAGRIYNRRMVHRANVSHERSKAGKEGAKVTNENRKQKSDLPQQNSGKDIGKALGKKSASSILPFINDEKAVASAPAKLKGSRLPEDWQPTADDRSFAISLGLDPAWVAGKFRDYWHSKPGAGGVKLNWVKTWNNWCRSEAERKPGAKPVAQEPSDGLTSEQRLWRDRWQGYRERKFWLDDWGPKPGEQGCRVPDIARKAA